MNYKTEGYELYKDFNDCVYLIEQELVELEDKNIATIIRTNILRMQDIRNLYLSEEDKR